MPYESKSIFSKQYIAYRYKHTPPEIVDFYIENDNYINSVISLDNIVITELAFSDVLSYFDDDENYLDRFDSFPVRDTVYRKGDNWPMRVRFAEQLAVLPDNKIYLVIVNGYNVEITTITNPIIATDYFDAIVPYQSFVREIKTLRKMDTLLDAHNYHLCTTSTVNDSPDSIMLCYTPFYPNNHLWNACFYCKQVAELYARSLKSHLEGFYHG